MLPDHLGRYRLKFQDTVNFSTRQAVFQHNFQLTDPSQEELDSIFGNPQERRVLDLGCATGIPLFPLGPELVKQPEMFGLDLSWGMVEYLRQKAGLSNPVPKIIQADAQTIPFPSGSFDTVYARHMLYHVPDIEKALNEVKRVLRPGGKLIVTANSLQGKPEIRSIHNYVLTTFQASYKNLQETSRFSSENGRQILEQVFDDIRFIPWSGVFTFTDVPHAMRYYVSTGLFLQTHLSASEQECFYTQIAQQIQHKIDENDSFKVNVCGSIYIASN